MVEMKILGLRNFCLFVASFCIKEQLINFFIILFRIQTEKLKLSQLKSLQF